MALKPANCYDQEFLRLSGLQNCIRNLKLMSTISKSEPLFPDHPGRWAGNGVPCSPLIPLSDSRSTKNAIRSMRCEPPDLPPPGQKSRAKYTRASRYLIGGERTSGKAMDSRLASVGAETILCCPEVCHCEEPPDNPASGGHRVY